VKEGEMIEISISRELAAAYPGFIAGCAQRGHRVEVFGEATERAERCVGDGMTAQAAQAPGPTMTGGVRPRGSGAHRCAPAAARAAHLSPGNIAAGAPAPGQPETHPACDQPDR
jgi:hypothetical protein